MEENYYNLLLTGRSGLGKSKTGYKLVGQTEKRKLSDVEEQPQLSFSISGKVLQGEERPVRVLMTAGFFSSDTPMKASGVCASQCNLEIFCWVILVQATLRITVDCVVYFLPTRGVLEKVDRHLQDELKVM